MCLYPSSLHTHHILDHNDKCLYSIPIDSTSMHLPKAPEQLLASGYTDSSVSLIWNHPQHDAVETKQQIIGKYIKLCVIRKLWILLPVKKF